MSGRRSLGARFNQAFLFAAEKHASQTRKKTDVPYISHLMSVAGLVLEEIRQRFGDRVAEIVKGCTDAYTLPKPPWKQRKLEYLEVLRRADEDIRLVSAADKLHNVRSILADYRREGDSVWERFSGRREGTLWYYRAVLDVLRQGKTNRLVDELERVVTELETLATKGSARSASL